MNILVIGGGGREHALAWKVTQSPLATQVFVTPGNAGTATEQKTANIDIQATDLDGLLRFAQENSIELTIVGPEAPLAAGIVDRFNQAGLKCFGPTQKAAQLESSKAFSKAFMQQHHIPTAGYQSFTDIDQALNYVRQQKLPIVIKADGLAAGKGVVIAQTLVEAEAAIKAMLGEHQFGEASNKIVIEEFLTGEEASFIVMVDGEHILPLATSQDHKARDEGDKGPNTGGMGAYSPAPVVTPTIATTIMQTIIKPTVTALKANGTPFTGFLYAGVMIDDAGQPQVLEFNCRLGDPETQPIMMRLESDLVVALNAACVGRLNQITLKWKPETALGVVLAAKGYPGSYPKGEVIKHVPVETATTKVFHAGTKQMNSQLVTNGGRVLCACALGKDTAHAQTHAYQLVNKIDWPSAYYRTDIGFRAIEKTIGFENLM